MSSSQPPDSDLADLLGNQAPAPLNDRNDSPNKVSASMNLDHLTKVGVSISSSPHNSSSKNKKNTSHSFLNQPMGLCEFLSSYTSMLCQYYPTACGSCFMLLVFALVIGLANLIFNPTEVFGVVGPLADDTMDNLMTPSKYEQSLGKVDHWCLQGGNEHCQCQDPLMPLSRMDHLSWVEAIKGNRKLVEQNPTPDVAILGESVVEAMAGRWMGQTRSPQMAQLKTSFAEKFQQSGVTGVALGVAGDTAPNVLWRLLHGELPATFHPKVWWISLGMNDLARMECSEEIVMLGILRIVEEILVQRPNAKIVINSILPMGNIRSGAYPLLSDYQEAFSPVLPPQGNRRNLVQKDETIPERGLKRLFPPRDGNTNRPPQFTPTTATAQQAETQERLRDEQFRKKRRQRNKRTKNNPVLNDKKKIKKYSLVGKSRKKRLPLWTSIQAINKQLEIFCAKQAKQQKPVQFFNANTIFVGHLGSRDRIKSNTITLLGYPRPFGFRLWQDAIIEVVKSIISKEEKEDKTNLLLQSSDEDFNVDLDGDEDSDSMESQDN